MGRKKLENKKTVLTIRMDVDYLGIMDEMSKAFKISKGRLIRIAINEFMIKYAQDFYDVAKLGKRVNVTKDDKIKVHES